MHISYRPTCSVLIDGSFADTIAQQTALDFSLLISGLTQRYRVTNIFYYTVVPPGEADFPKRRLLDWLSYNGIIVRTKIGSVAGERSGAASTSLSLEIAVAAMELSLRVETIVLLTNDVNILAAVKAIQRKAKSVAMVGAPSRSRVRAHRTLLRSVDTYYPLDEICGVENAVQHIHSARRS